MVIASVTLALFAVSLRSPLTTLRPVAVPPRAFVVVASGTPLELVDVDGDQISFVAENDALKMIVGGEVWCEAVKSLEYATSDGAVRQDYGVGNFELSETNRAEQAAALEKLALEMGVEWTEWVELPELEDLDEEGEEGSGGGAWANDDSLDKLLEAAQDVVFPPEVEELLDIDQELIDSKPQARVLYQRLLAIYPDEAAVIDACKRNSALIYPYLNKPAFIDGSWKVCAAPLGRSLSHSEWRPARAARSPVALAPAYSRQVLLSMMSEEEALEVVTKNPGVLACNPAGLATSDAQTIMRAAGLVDGVENFLETIGYMKLWEKKKP